MVVGVCCVVAGWPLVSPSNRATLILTTLSLTIHVLAAILANLLLGSNSADELADDASYVAPADDYGVPYEPPVNSYGAPAVTYEEPAPSYENPAYEAPAPAQSYEPAPAAYEPPAQDSYGSPQADPLPAYQPTRY